MGNIITILSQIFMGKEDESLRVGISEFRQQVIPVIKKTKSSKKIAPQQLRISELMRKGA